MKNKINISNFIPLFYIIGFIILGFLVYQNVIYKSDNTDIRYNNNNDNNNIIEDTPSSTIDSNKVQKTKVKTTNKNSSNSNNNQNSGKSNNLDSNNGSNSNNDLNNNTNNDTNNNSNNSSNNNLNNDTNNNSNNSNNSNNNSYTNNNSSSNTTTTKPAQTPSIINPNKIVLNSSNGTYFINKDKSVNLKATVYPENANNKTVTWTSSNTKVATVNSSGQISFKSPGESIIKATTSNGLSANYNLIIKKKMIMFITASQGVRMNKYFLSYTSDNGNKYSVNDQSLKYIFKSGSGLSYHLGEGLDEGISFIHSYSSMKKYMKFNVFFILPGNDIKNYTCNQITSSSIYSDYAKKYNQAYNKLSNGGYSIKMFLISNNPVDPKKATNGKIVSYSSPYLCDSGYISNWKHYQSNKKMKSELEKLSDNNVKFVNMFNKYLTLDDKDKKKFKWIRSYTTEDGSHWDKANTKDYMTLLFNSTNM